MGLLNLQRFMVHEVTVRHPGWRTDRYGNRVADWNAGSTETVKGWLARDASTETNDGREAISSEWSLTLMPDAPVNAVDRIEREGMVYRIVGGVERAQAPGGTHHLVVRLRTVEG